MLNTCLVHKSLSNEDAWTAYRIGEAFSALGKPEACEFYSKATNLAPFMLDFQSKLGVELMTLNRVDEAAKVFDFIISEDSKNGAALTNRGRIYFIRGDNGHARQNYDKALKLDPDNLQALKNQVDLLNSLQQYEEAKGMLDQILKRFPGDKDAKALLAKMKSLKLISAK